MKHFWIQLVWLSYLLRGLLGRRRFIGITPPFMRSQRIYDRVRRKWLTFSIRDDDDWIQVEHIFLNDEFDLAKTGRASKITTHYHQILEQGQIPLIVDLGANIGLASRYFHQIHPEADLICVEPDAGNCVVARRNLPGSATLLEAAISNASGRAALIDTGRNCGFRVDPAEDGKVQLTTVPELLARASGRVPFLIKIDIEGFEENLFSGNTEWIDLFPILLIELHDWMLPGRLVTRNFLTEMASRDRDFIHFDGYVVSLSTQL